jgi:hypothetical protein
LRLAALVSAEKRKGGERKEEAVEGRRGPRAYLRFRPSTEGPHHPIINLNFRTRRGLSSPEDHTRTSLTEGARLLPVPAVIRFSYTTARASAACVRVAESRRGILVVEDPMLIISLLILSTTLDASRGGR